MDRRRYPIIFSMLICLCLIGCGLGEFNGSTSKPSYSGLSGRLVITGSSTIAPLAQEIARRFEKQHSGVRIDVQTGGSSRGIRDASTGAADIGMSSRELKPEESKLLNASVIAWDGVAFVVHQDNKINTLSDDQLRQIYTEQVKNWSALGGADARVVVSNRAEGRSELDLVCKYLGLEAGQIQADIVDGETQQALKSVIGNRKAITYVSVGAAQDAARRGEPVKLLPLKGVAASSKSVQSGKFPLARPLIMMVSKQRNENARLVKAFLKFASSEKVADAAVRLGYVPNSN